MPVYPPPPPGYINKGVGIVCPAAGAGSVRKPATSREETPSDRATSPPGPRGVPLGDDLVACRLIPGKVSKYRLYIYIYIYIYIMSA